jgi:hypothetical protein
MAETLTARHIHTVAEEGAASQATAGTVGKEEEGLQ